MAALGLNARHRHTDDVVVIHSHLGDGVVPHLVGGGVVVAALEDDGAAFAVRTGDHVETTVETGQRDHGGGDLELEGLPVAGESSATCRGDAVDEGVVAPVPCADVERKPWRRVLLMGEYDGVGCCEEDGALENEELGELHARGCGVAIVFWLSCE